MEDVEDLDRIEGGEELSAEDAEAAIDGLSDDVGDDVVQEDAPPPKPAGKAPVAKDETSATLKALQKQIETLQTQTRERGESERYWADKYQELAGQRSKVAEPEAEADPFENESAEDLVNNIGLKGRKALEERGFIRKSDVAKMIETEARRIAREEAGGVVRQTEQKLTRDAELMSRFPDLNDKNSDLFKEAGAILRDMVKDDPKAAQDTVKFELAVTRAEANLLRRAATNAGKQSRAAAQMPSRGERSGGSADDAEEANSGWGPQQAIFAKNMGVSKADFLRFVPKKRGA